MERNRNTLKLEQIQVQVAETASCPSICILPFFYRNKTFNFFDWSQGCLLSAWYSCVTKFWPMGCKWNCVPPSLGNVLKGTGCPLPLPLPFYCLECRQDSLKLEQPSQTPRGGSHRPWIIEYRIAREEIWVFGNFKMLPYQFWAALFLTFMWEKYISFSSHYCYEFSHLYSWPIPTTQEGYWKNMIQEHMLQTKPSYMGNGYGTGQPLLVYPDPWGLCLWVSLWICSHLLASLHGWTFSACLLIS